MVAEYFERHGDYTVIRPKFLKRYRNGGRPKRLVHDWIRHWENGIIPYVISEASYNGELCYVIQLWAIIIPTNSSLYPLPLFSSCLIRAAGEPDYESNGRMGGAHMHSF